jgi:hypothetical protein
MRILFPRDENDLRDAMESAAWKPDLFRELAGMAEASDTTLVNDLIQRGFTMDGAKQAIASFRETVSLVGSPVAGYDVPSGTDEPLPELSSAVATSASTGPGLLNQRRVASVSGAQADYSWPLPDGVRVEIRFVGGAFTKAGLRVLRKYLDVLEETIPDAVEPTALRPAAESTDSARPA